MLPKEGSTTDAKLQLAKGKLCLAVQKGQKSGKLVLGKCESNEAVVFAFAGFAEPGEEASRALYEEQEV